MELNRKSMKGNQNATRYIYTLDGIKYNMNELCDKLNCSKSKITESFRRNLGLVKSGRLIREIKQ